MATVWYPKSKTWTIPGSLIEVTARASWSDVDAMTQSAFTRLGHARFDELRREHQHDLRWFTRGRPRPRWLSTPLYIETVPGRGYRLRPEHFPPDVETESMPRSAEERGQP